MEQGNEWSHPNIGDSMGIRWPNLTKIRHGIIKAGLIDKDYYPRGYAYQWDWFTIARRYCITPPVVPFEWSDAYNIPEDLRCVPPDGSIGGGAPKRDTRRGMSHKTIDIIHQGTPAEKHDLRYHGHQQNEDW